MNMRPDDAPPPPRPRWVGWALLVVMGLVMLGMLNLGWRILKPGAIAGEGEATAQAAAESSVSSSEQASLAQGRALVGSSNCMRCHGMERHYVGPAFRQISARYRDLYRDRDPAEAIDYLARKIREGSVGQWGRVVMPRHPQITEAQARQMGQWLMSVPPAEAGSPDGVASGTR